MSDKKVSAFVIKSFKDDGTKERFTKGDIVEIAEGAFGNYEAASLVRKPTADDKKQSADDKKPASTAAA